MTFYQNFVPIIDAPFLPANIWRKQFIEKGYCNGITEEKLCYKLAEFLLGEDDANMNFVSISCIPILPPPKLVTHLAMKYK